MRKVLVILALVVCFGFMACGNEQQVGIAGIYIGMPEEDFLAGTSKNQ
jgi:hypothetical protein